MSDSIKPFLKWPGGKRWLAHYIQALLAGRKFERYFEPFLGGGAIFFALRPTSAILSDINPDLINIYKQVKYRPRKLLERLQEIKVNKRAYLCMRSYEPECHRERAVRFLYLNRTAFAGMYRLDQQGRFNVPYGGGSRTPAILWRDNLLVNASRALKGATILTADFEKIIAMASEGDLVYCDPTYTVAHNNNGFIRYNEHNFSWKDQIRLAEASLSAAARGASVLVSNAFHKELTTGQKLDNHPPANKIEVLKVGH